MSEAAMWGYIRRKVEWPVPPFSAQIHMERLTEKLKGGVPDVRWVTNTRVQGMLELKYLPPHTGGGWRIRFRPNQLPWLRRDREWGGRSAVLLRFGEQWLLYYSEASLDWVRKMKGPEPWPSVTWPQWPGIERLTNALIDQP